MGGVIESDSKLPGPAMRSCGERSAEVQPSSLILPDLPRGMLPVLPGSIIGYRALILLCLIRGWQPS
jgi:hypothetical protein